MNVGSPGPSRRSGRAVGLGTLARTALPVLAIAVPVVTVVAILAAAGSTLGYDYLMYDQAARRLLGGGPLYDLAFLAPGPNGLFDYPPPFVLAILPFSGVLPTSIAALAWIAFLNVCFVVGVAVLPVRPTTRWFVLLLAGLSWPYLYAVKLGQLGPLLFLLYAAAWRWANRPLVVGLAAALGTAAKLQPVVLFGWAIVTRRFRAVAAGVGVLATLVIVATIVAGSNAASDWYTLISRVSGNALTAPGVVSLGAIAYRAGIPEGTATLIQWASVTAVGVVAVAAWIRYPPPIAIPVTAMASILVSPIVWPHYAVLVLLSVAVLLERGQWWAVGLPLAAWLPVDAVYPIIFGIALLAPIVVAERGRGMSTAPEGRGGERSRSPFTAAADP